MRVVSKESKYESEKQQRS